MCGILALFGAENCNGDLRAELLSLSKLLRHRGPDWNGITCFRNCYLAHERLAINGLLSGAQPITNISGDLALSVNGEIYNHLELRAELEKINPNVVFTTDSDCEVILHLFKEHGPEFLKKVYVNGMYAFVLYDNSTDTYFVARDPIGIIPLYIGYGSDGTIWFSSELKGLQKNCDHIELFPPGHYVVGNSLKKEKLNPEPKPFYQDEWISNPDFIPCNPVDYTVLRNNLESAVRRHLLAEVPFGVLLSGGLDSSLVASIALREYNKAGNQGKLRSFCIGLKGSPDLAAAEQVANFLGTRHFSFEFTVQQGLDVLHDVIYHLETFDVTTVRASTPMFLLSRRVKATGVKMVLSGEGADEIMAGYLYFHKAPNPEELHKETVRKLKDLHKYDCLRANKSTMAWGLEARVPFLDREFLEYAMNLDPSCKMSGDRIEKYALRKAFDTPEDPYLPQEVLWRQKEQFSDGVGYGWIDHLKIEAENSVTDLQMKFASSRFPVSTPRTKEEYMYRDIFSKHFPAPAAAATVPQGKSVACSTPAAMAWDESFSRNADPSGRAIAGVHVKAYE
ncbi:asparagine synthetase [glutamine-hydrolyzing] 2 [Eurytemora carolleeae]|uniref:asparagine synthetase [glutamine-hydrolyzing] 2 n=1 Tax=Eurytemora carolleeae TaxID=1294199 RepID=UPI000C77D041|nr:asparagine synthetase [glutamine-hydrolyzing] 2 [Eurytemora carolleeae]|eukprot:XP_023324027.1 asparagine synthetase [glutamine-hydrolyzing] 2-like [Eurytemora affinis]